MYAAVSLYGRAGVKVKFLKRTCFQGFSNCDCYCRDYRGTVPVSLLVESLVFRKCFVKDSAIADRWAIGLRDRKIHQAELVGKHVWDNGCQVSGPMVLRQKRLWCVPDLCLNAFPVMLSDGPSAATG